MVICCSSNRKLTHSQSSTTSPKVREGWRRHLKMSNTCSYNNFNNWSNCFIAIEHFVPSKVTQTKVVISLTELNDINQHSEYQHT